MINLFKKRDLWGLHRTYKESKDYDQIIVNVFNSTALEVYGTTAVRGIAVFAYGSPGRFELIGGDSDADVFIAEVKKTNKGEHFKKLLIERWSSYNFSKIDIPPFGTYEEIDLYLRVSLVEGNQILETRFLCGDKSVRKEVESRIRKHDSTQRELKNILFNRFYFNQYFKQRIREGAPNVKYCPGGSRDFLFFYWYCRLCEKINKEDSSLSGLTQPKVKEGLERLFMEGDITGSEFGLAFEAINAIIELRTDILKLNKSTPQRGLTFLDKSTILGLQQEYNYPGEGRVEAQFKSFTSSINNLSKVLWRKTLEKAAFFYWDAWKEQFDLAYNISTSERIRSKISSDDPLLRMALIWGASESGQKAFFDHLAKKYCRSRDWATICSLVCSPLCNSDILHIIGTGIAKERGYGYILRVIARNKNVSRKTLISIAKEPLLEKRYTEVARAALSGGNSKANNQI